MTQSDFVQREMRAVGKRVYRLGLSVNFGVEPSAIEAALERGVNYLFWTSYKTSQAKPVVRAALQKNREQIVLAAGPTFGYLAGSIRRSCERLLRSFGTDYIDVFQLFWLSKMSAWRPAVIEELEKLKHEGKIRAIGASIHDRPRAGRLAEDSPLDMLMIRYNAAHPGAEREIFPHLEKRKPSVVAYTATAWRKLLKPHKGWEGEPMSAGDCYRFCLTNDHVDVVLTGPKNGRELTENLDALARGPMSAEELERWRAFGKVAHG